MRGFNGIFQDFYTSAGKISRSGQRLANAVAAGNVDFILFSFGVSQVSVKGLTLEELSALTGAVCRAVQFDVPREDLECLKQIGGFESFNPEV